MAEPIPGDLEAIGREIVDACFRVHIALGAGLLESVYQTCLCHELRRRGLRIEREIGLPIVYDTLTINDAFRIDILVEGAVIVELKSVQALLPVHEAQLITYLKLSNCRLGFLVNFNVPLIKDGIKRLVR
ncbi:MAG TPA: GxxExxY protein [Tepidisphaeraceae bacterium]|jgi:GxxExxY protein